MIGYRFSVDKDKNTYIIKLNAPNEGIIKRGIEFSQVGCVCLSITNVNTEEEIDKALLQGVQKVWVKYEKNREIPGRCWFCDSTDALFHRYLRRDEFTGLIRYGGGSLYRRLRDYILHEANLQLQEIAEEMNITTEELTAKILFLENSEFISYKEMEEAGKPILDATNAVTQRKIQNGEMLPGWKRYLIERGMKP